VTTLCVALIVKNEQHVIERCINSFKNHIDYWVICDTGSTDDTKEIISDKLRDIPGELHETEWKDFGHNRSELMKLCFNKADYILLIDADMELRVNDLNFTDELYHTSYMLKYEGDMYFRQKMLVKGDINWRYEGVTHEYIIGEGDISAGPTDLVSLVHYSDGSRHSYKNQEDVSLLEKSVENNPDNPRDVFYLAQSYECNGDLEKASEMYKRRSEMGGWDEETYIAKLRRAECISKNPEDSHYPIGLYIDALKFRPFRFEAAYRVINYFRRKRLYKFSHDMSLDYLRKAETEDLLFVDKTAKNYKIPLEYALSCFHVGKKDVCFRVCEDYVKRVIMPSEYRECFENILRFRHS